MFFILYNSDIVDCWIKATSENKESEVYKYVERKIGEIYFDKKKLLQSVNFFHIKMNKIWKESRYNLTYLKNKHSSWLNNIFFDADDVSSIVFDCYSKIKILLNQLNLNS